MKIIILKNKEEVSKKAASAIFNSLKRNPSIVLGLATGETMIPLYKKIRNKNLNFSKVKTINLDEYIGLNEKNRNSFHYFMNKHLFNHIGINEKNIYFPTNRTKKLPKVDLQILGLGINGHIGFNEPGSKPNSRIRKIKLSESTRRANSRFFGLLGKVPRYAYTLGMKNILNSKKIILIAFGKSKAEAIKKTIEEKISREVPASLLRKHKDFTIIIDKKAASKLIKTRLKYASYKKI